MQKIVTLRPEDPYCKKLDTRQKTEATGHPETDRYTEHTHTQTEIQTYTHKHTHKNSQKVRQTNPKKLTNINTQLIL